MPRHQPKTYAPRAFKRIFFLAFTLLAVSGLIPVAIKVGEQLRSKTAVGEVIEESPISSKRRGTSMIYTIQYTAADGTTCRTARSDDEVPSVRIGSKLNVHYSPDRPCETPDDFVGLMIGVLVFVAIGLIGSHYAWRRTDSNGRTWW